MGRIAEKLSDDDWVKFNNYQRVHMNYLEWLVLHIFGYVLNENSCNVRRVVINS
jgi:hypothetical protein